MSNEPQTNASKAIQEGQAPGETMAFTEKRADTGSEAVTLPPNALLGLEPKALVGQSFQDLEILEEIGRGGMGLVFKARQKTLDRLVAVKLLLAEHFADPVRMARFVAEARAAASLSHQNIVQVYQVGASPWGHFFTMEYVDGPTVEALIKKGTLSVPFTVHIVRAVANAVHYAHSKGIVHRDLKPGNIMIDRTQRPVVMDFGIAKFVGKPSCLTQQGVIVGTPAYMAPEQSGETSDQVGPLSDVYSLGGILYSMLTGRVPYEAATPLQTVLKVIGPDLPPPVRSLRPKVPAEIERICMKCLSKRPADRYASALALARDLGRFAASFARQQSRSKAPTKSTPINEGTSPGGPSSPSVQIVSVATGKKIRLRRPIALLGRSSQCDIVVRAANVSKHHCQIIVEPDGVVVENLGSANGTYVNGRPIQTAPLQDGDRLRVADHEFEVQLEQPER
jgi:serine/threonine protein kinase